MTLATSSRLPKPPKTQPMTLRSVRFGGGDIRLAPNCPARRCAWTASSPVFGATANLRSASSTDTWCQSSSDRSTVAAPGRRVGKKRMEGSESADPDRGAGRTSDCAFGALVAAAVVRLELGVF